MSAISSSSLAASLFSVGNSSGASSPTATWLASTETAIQNQANQGGLLGMLSNAAAGNNNGSVSSFLSNSSSTADAFASIAQNSVSSMTSLTVQIATQTMQAAAAKKQQDLQSSLAASQQNVQPTNTLDPYIYFPDGTSIDTTNNIMTMSNGDQYDIATGAKYVDPSMVIQMANGSYLDTKNNILTMADGTRIDSVTGIKLSVSA